MSTVVASHPMHAGLEVLTPALRDQNTELIAAKCIGLLAGYDMRWFNAPYRVDAVESVCTSDLYNPTTHATSRTFRISGKIDIHATDLETGKRVIFDHKTTSSDITDPNATYWRQLTIEGQVSHYFLLEWLRGAKVDYGVWDVVRKPGIAPKMLNKTDAAAVSILKRYAGVSLSPDCVAEFTASKDARETPTMYANRLALDCTKERPEWYFQRRQVARLDGELHEYAKELWDHSQDLIVARRTGRQPRNSGACMTYGSPCKFLGICSGYDNPDSDKWVRKEWVHPELPVGDGDGKDVLTNSRIRCFQTCRRKHQLQYELGIERAEESDTEALYFGSLWHEAQEAYWLTLKANQERGN